MPSKYDITAAKLKKHIVTGYDFLFAFTDTTPNGNVGSRGFRLSQFSGCKPASFCLYQKSSFQHVAFSAQAIAMV